MLTHVYIYHVLQVEPKAVELVEGYVIYLTQRQLDAAIDAAKNNPTRLVRNLMGVFFTHEVLATSSAFGTRIQGTRQGYCRDVHP